VLYYNIAAKSQEFSLDDRPLSPDRRLEFALRFLGLIALEAPAVAPIAREAAHEIGSAMAAMQRISSWVPIPAEPYFRELAPAEVASLMGIGRRA
jgi:hypothetical protein